MTTDSFVESDEEQLRRLRREAAKLALERRIARELASNGTDEFIDSAPPPSPRPRPAPPRRDSFDNGTDAFIDSGSARDDEDEFDIVEGVDENGRPTGELMVVDRTAINPVIQEESNAEGRNVDPSRINPDYLEESDAEGEIPEAYVGLKEIIEDGQATGDFEVTDFPDDPSEFIEDSMGSVPLDEEGEFLRNQFLATLIEEHPRLKNIRTGLAPGASQKEINDALEQNIVRRLESREIADERGIVGAIVDRATTPLAPQEWIDAMPGPLQGVGNALRDLTTPLDVAVMVGTAGFGSPLSAAIRGGRLGILQGPGSARRLARLLEHRIRTGVASKLEPASNSSKFRRRLLEEGGSRAQKAVDDELKREIEDKRNEIDRRIGELIY